MQRVDITINEQNLDFNGAKKVALDRAEQENEFALVVSWWDRETGNYSPHCLK